MESQSTNEDVTAEQPSILEQQEITTTPLSPEPTLSLHNDGVAETVSQTRSNTNTKKRSFEDISFDCEEHMPKIRTFSRFRPHQLLPHQVIAAAYTTLMKGGFSHQSSARCQLLRNFPSLNETLRLLLPWKTATERGEPKKVNKGSDTTLLKELGKIPEILRMQSFGFPTDGILDIPLAFDWSAPLGLGSTTGSAAFNRGLLQVAALHSEYINKVPQLSPEEFYLALKHESQQSSTVHTISPPVDDATRDVYRKLLQVGTTASMTHLKSPAQMKEFLGQFHARAAALRTRQFRLKDAGKDQAPPTAAESELVAEPETQKPQPMPWSTSLSTLLAQQGYDAPNAFCSPHDTLY